MNTGDVSIWPLIIVMLLVVVPFWKIFGKAGYSSWLSLLMLIPLVNLIMLYFLAFSSWPAQRPQGM
jgi:hypothetical protein